MKRLPILWFFIFSLFFCIQVSILSDDTGFTITGELMFKKYYDITVEIINKEEYDKNLTSSYVVIIKVDEEAMAQKKVNFSISGVPVGDYIVKVYQDLNNNGKFDFALIGGEPLGTYRKPGFTLGRPSFKSLAFTLTQDLGGIQIVL